MKARLDEDLSRASPRLVKLENAAAFRMSMSPFLRAAGVAALLAVAGCSTNDTSNYRQEPMLGATPPPADYSGSLDTNQA
jgi:hypothetical protein